MGASIGKVVKVDETETDLRSCKRQSNPFERSVRTAAHTLLLSHNLSFLQSLLKGSVEHYIPYESHNDTEGKITEISIHLVI